ncbi:MAG: NnrS family protein [Sulfurimonas sp.]|jgi:uncharacterized protein involved in response to NO|nr:NnrS family protein [Sulfurimonadaceae bacterium]
MDTKQPLNATKHYKYYPDEPDISPLFAYGFRPIFLLLAPYMVISAFLWTLYYTGSLPLHFENPLEWHIYEFLFGVGIAGIMAFLFTGLPELFPGLVPIVGKRLKMIIALWVAGRVAFWLMPFIGTTIVGIINISLWLVVIAYAFKPVVLDRLQRHSSIAYTLVALVVLQVIYFAALGGYIDIPTMDILKLSVGVMMVLIVLADRRVSMEAINERLEHEKIDDVFVAKPFRYNLAVFTILLFSLVEFFYPSMHSTLGWLGFGAGAAILGVINDLNLKFESLKDEPFAYYMAAIALLMALGYFFLGYSYLFDFGFRGNYMHFLTSGAFGLSFYVVMVVVTYVHTGRVLKSNWWVMLGVVLIVVSTFLRALIDEIGGSYVGVLHAATLLWILPFVIYWIKTKDFLLSPRVDGIKG